VTGRSSIAIDVPIAAGSAFRRVRQNVSLTSATMGQAGGRPSADQR
jgi:hypothetical protein